MPRRSGRACAFTLARRLRHRVVRLRREGGEQVNKSWRPILALQLLLLFFSFKQNRRSPSADHTTRQYHTIPYVVRLCRSIWVLFCSGGPVERTIGFEYLDRRGAYTAGGSDLCRSRETEKGYTSLLSVCSQNF